MNNPLQKTLATGLKRACESLKGIHFQNTNLNGSCQKRKLTLTELLKDESPPKLNSKESVEFDNKMT